MGVPRDFVGFASCFPCHFGSAVLFKSGCFQRLCEGLPAAKLWARRRAISEQRDDCEAPIAMLAPEGSDYFVRVFAEAG